MAVNPLARAIEQAIDASGLSVAEIAERSGISKSLIYGWMKTTSHKPSRSNLKKLAATLGVTVESLQAEAPSDSKAPPVTDYTTRPHSHYMLLFERSVLEQRTFIAELMLETIAAHTADLRDALARETEVTTGPLGGQRREPTAEQIAAGREAAERTKRIVAEREARPRKHRESA